MNITMLIVLDIVLFSANIACVWYHWYKGFGFEKFESTKFKEIDGELTEVEITKKRLIIRNWFNLGISLFNIFAVIVLIRSVIVYH